MAVRLFVGNLAYSTTEADLRRTSAPWLPPSQVVLPVDRETGRPRGFAFVEFLDRANAEQAIQRFNGQPFNGRPLAVSEARAREDRGPGGPPPGGQARVPRPGRAAVSRLARREHLEVRVHSTAAVQRPAHRARNRNFGPDAKPQRGGNAKGKKKGEDKPRGPIPMKNTGRSFSLDDVDAVEEALPEMDDIATSRPTEDLDEE